MPDYENYERRRNERILSIENSDEENGDMVDLEELGAKAEEVFEAKGQDYSDDDFGPAAGDEDEYEDFEFDDDDEEDEPEDAKPHSDKVLTLDDIVSADDLDEEAIWIEKWQGNVVIRSITKREFDHMRRQARRKEARGKVNDILERELICNGVVKPRISAADYERLQEKSPGPLVEILNAIYKKSGLERESEKERERRFPVKR